MATKITDFASAARLGQTVSPLSTSATSVEGDTIDMIDADGPTFAILNANPSSEDATVSGTVQSSDDAVNWTDVPDAVFPSEGGSIVRAITFQRPARYLRLVLSISNDDEPVAVSATIGEQWKLL